MNNQCLWPDCGHDTNCSGGPNYVNPQCPCQQSTSSTAAKDPRDALIERLRDGLREGVSWATWRTPTVGTDPDASRLIILNALAEATAHLARPVAQQAEGAEAVGYVSSSELQYLQNGKASYINLWSDTEGFESCVSLYLAPPTAQAAALPEVSDEDVAVSMDAYAAEVSSSPFCEPMTAALNAYRQRLQDRMKENTK